MARTLSTVKSRLAPLQGRLRTPPKTSDAVYRSNEWSALVAAIIAHRGRRCEKCGRDSDELGAPIKIYADHHHEIRDGGAALDPTNVRLLCGKCHARKTAAARAARMAKRYQR